MNQDVLWLAPMMGYTHGWFRSMIQALHPRVRVMTEMVSAQAIRYAPQQLGLWVHPLESEPALQLACAQLSDLVAIEERLALLPYTHINLNAGCPSGRVAVGGMGACMMYAPERTREILAHLGVLGYHASLKTRLAVDDCSDNFWDAWCQTVLTSGVSEIFLHARAALLSGLNPSQNRHIPPLRYDRAYEIASQHPEVAWVLNGGIKTCEQIVAFRCDPVYSGLMLGRVAYQHPKIFWDMACMDGVADFSNIERWMASVSEVAMNSGMICALLALSKGVSGARVLRQAIVASKGKKFDTRPLLEAVYESYIEFRQD